MSHNEAKISELIDSQPSVDVITAYAEYYHAVQLQLLRERIVRTRDADLAKHKDSYWPDDVGKSRCRATAFDEVLGIANALLAVEHPQQSDDDDEPDEAGVYP